MGQMVGRGEADRRLEASEGIYACVQYVCRSCDGDNIEEEVLTKGRIIIQITNVKLKIS
jgi:hypothetical protein